MATEMEPVALGFDGIVGEGDGSTSPTAYTVQFTPASGEEAPEKSGLLEEGRAKGSLSPTEEEKVRSENAALLSVLRCLELTG